MKRWNIEEIAYYSHDNQIRKLTFELGRLNIITGASGTGKSAVIQTIDYCFGSSSCEIPAFISDRISAVAIKLVSDQGQAIAGRRVRAGKSKTSHEMFFEVGTQVVLPERSSAFSTPIARELARAQMERLFSISDAPLQSSTAKEDESSRLSLRQVTAFMYLSKNVIDSERTLFHGLDSIKSAPHIVASLPYFLGALDAKALQAKFRVRGLLKGIEAEERKKINHQKDDEEFGTTSLALLYEAKAGGMHLSEDAFDSKTTRLQNLKDLANWSAGITDVVDGDPNVSPLARVLHQKRAESETLVQLRRELRDAIATSSLSSDVEKGVERQKRKISAIRFFSTEQALKTCPVCLTEIEEPSHKHAAITRAFSILSAEHKVVSGNRPILDAFTLRLNKFIDEQVEKIRLLDVQAKELIAADDAVKKAEDTAHKASRIAGRIGFFLEHAVKQEPFDHSKLDLYRSDFDIIDSEYGTDAIEEKLHAAELSISQSATDIFRMLPVSEEYANTSLVFNSKKPAVLVINPNTNRSYKLPDLGSDQNYLSVHIALTFGLHRFFALKSSPVPGIIILDQVSRPYFPEQTENDGREEGQLRSEDASSLLQYFNFMFDEVERANGLQVIVLEHAYFTDDERYKNAVRYRWRKDGTERLIPPGWPAR
jgi:energy-coupling factor transporter ATP-binding protein EcfA2